MEVMKIICYILLRRGYLQLSQENCHLFQWGKMNLKRRRIVSLNGNVPIVWHNSFFEIGI